MLNSIKELLGKPFKDVFAFLKAHFEDFEMSLYEGRSGEELGVGYIKVSQGNILVGSSSRDYYEGCLVNNVAITQIVNNCPEIKITLERRLWRPWGMQNDAYVAWPTRTVDEYRQQFLGIGMATDYTACYSEARKFRVKRVIVNGPATIVLWEDGTKTVAKCLPEDKFDFEKGIAICFMKKAAKESCVKIFEKAREDNLKKLQGELEKLNKELEKKKCSEDATSTS